MISLDLGDLMSLKRTNFLHLLDGYKIIMFSLLHFHNKFFALFAFAVLHSENQSTGFCLARFQIVA